jgi:predicted Zn-dependent protease
MFSMREVSMNRSTMVKRYVALCLCALLMPLVVGGCATVGGVLGQIYIMPSDEEVKMGEGLSQEVAKQEKIYDNAAVTAYVQDVGGRIVKHCDRQDIAYHFAVIDKDEVNAFAMPGGYVYVYTGLMKDIDDEAELAAVLAHEVGHVVARHAAQRISAMYAADALQKAVLGENPGFFGKLFAGAMTTGGFLAYSRENEYEADQLGHKFMYAAGYDPKGMVDLLGKLQSGESREPTKFEEMLATHPATSERLARVEAMVAADPKLANPIRNKAEYTKIKAQLPK